MNGSSGFQVATSRANSAPVVCGIIMSEITSANSSPRARSIGSATEGSSAVSTT